MLASLIFAFRLRGRFQPAPNSGRLAQRTQAAFRRPEQLVFFAPVALLTCMLALKMKTGMVTVSWGIEGVLVFLLALAVNERSFRLTGLGLLMACAAKILFMDLFRMERRDQILTALGVGVILILVGFMYSKYRERIRQLL